MTFLSVVQVSLSRCGIGTWVGTCRDGGKESLRIGLG